MPFEIVRVDQKLHKVSDMEQMIAEATGIHTERLILLLRHEKAFSNQATVEYFNMDWTKKKKICDLRTKFD